MDKVTREMTFEEEAAFYEKEARAEFAKETGNGDDGGVNNILRRGMRIIRKARQEITSYEEAYKNGYEKGYRDGKDSAMESIMFPKLLIRQPERSKEELEDLMNSPVIIHKSREEIIPLYHNGWIPVSERLPEKDKEVLCLTDIGSYWLAMFNRCDDGLWSDGEFWSSEKYVTHWMPLPEPPKEE